MLSQRTSYPQKENDRAGDQTCDPSAQVLYATDQTTYTWARQKGSKKEFLSDQQKIKKIYTDEAMFHREDMFYMKQNFYIPVGLYRELILEFTHLQKYQNPGKLDKMKTPKWNIKGDVSGLSGEPRPKVRRHRSCN